MNPEQLQRVVHASLFAALMAVGAYIHIPMVPVPIVLQNLFVLLAGLLLGSRWGLASVGIYLLVGALGLPVFSGGRGGLGHFLGPTGGYLFGFALSAYVCGWISERSPGSMAWSILAVTTASLAVYAVGVPWLKLVTGMDWHKTALLGMVPFLVGDVLKAASAVLLARAVRPMLNRRLKAPNPA